METTLHRALIVALSTVALTVILRNAPVIRDWVDQLKKPWACNVCLPLYLCALSTGALYFYSPWDWTIVYAYLPAYALSYLILEKFLNRPTAPFIPQVFMDEGDPGVGGLDLLAEDEVTPDFRFKKKPKTLEKP